MGLIGELSVHIWHWHADCCDLGIQHVQKDAESELYLFSWWTGDDRAGDIGLEFLDCSGVGWSLRISGGGASICSILGLLWMIVSMRKLFDIFVLWYASILSSDCYSGLTSVHSINCRVAVFFFRLSPVIYQPSPVNVDLNWRFSFNQPVYKAFLLPLKRTHVQPAIIKLSNPIVGIDTIVLPLALKLNSFRRYNNQCFQSFTSCTFTKLLKLARCTFKYITVSSNQLFSFSLQALSRDVKKMKMIALSTVYQCLLVFLWIVTLNVSFFLHHKLILGFWF